jgi:hypothetical protein
VDGGRIAAELGIRPERKIRPSVLDLWGKLQDHWFGADPANDARYFNIRWLVQNSIPGTGEIRTMPTNAPGEA